MSEQPETQYEQAVAAVADREYTAAGNAYARAGWKLLAAPHHAQDPFDADEKGWVGKGMQLLLTSAICYRVAGQRERATHRSTEVGAVAADFQSILTNPVQQACCKEIRADATLVGGLGDATEAYNDTADAYREAGETIDDPQYWSTTPLFQAAATPLQQVARSTANGEIAVSWEDLHGADPTAPRRFLAHRATFKRQRFASLLDSVIEEGYLAAPRGTTAYNNATYRCPACESSDVNWVGNSILCLRCSTALKKQT